MRPSCSPRLTFVQFSRFCLLAFGGLPFLLSGAPGAELLVLDPTNFDEAVPHGKEVDSIYGDFLLRNEHVVAVIAQPRAERDANMTVREVGGCLIDLSTRAPDTNDQLSAFYPGASQFAYRSAEIYTGDGRWETKSSAAENLVQHSQIGLRCIAPSSPGKPRVTTTYWLADHARVLEVITVISNPHDEEVSVNVRDSIRSDKGFEAGFDADRNMVWVHDEWWRKAYGFIPQGTKSLPNAGSLSRARPVIDYVTAGDEQVQPQAVKLGSGQSLRLSRWIVPAANLLELRGLADQVRGLDLRTIHVSVQDDQGPIDHARVELFRGDTSLGVGRTLLSGSATFQVPPGDYRVIVSAIGRTDASCSFTADQSEVVVSMEQPGYVAAKITAEDGSPIACKVEFRGTAGGADPDFGPDTEVWQVKNLVYTENGSFTQAIAPGTYDIIISHGPEYDAIFANIKVERGGTTQLEGKLIRSVNTTGWVSSDFHSHSTPSGDNTSSQLGRVLNLLAEHVEFAPCTEHNRISTYGPHLQRLQAEHRMATCTGMELTGGPLPVNHQNAFPLQMRPRTQDGGAPRTDLDPVVQIERLAMWDDGSDKLVQSNHPDLIQIYGDRDLDGTPDEGFHKMFGFMDVVEVHPPHLILSVPDPAAPRENRGNPIFHWMQLLNDGHRITGVVNTDAHYTFHGSGWLRNYLASPTDDPARIDTMEMVHAAEQGHVIMTNGPFLTVSMAADEAGDEGGNESRSGTLPGGDLSAPDKKATLQIRVQCPNWHSINRVQVFFNGRAVETLNFTHANAREKFRDGVVKFDERIPLTFDSDTYVIVAAAGDGLQLGPVVGPDRANDTPIAVSNPIFVDVDGDGFQVNHDELDFPLPRKSE